MERFADFRQHGDGEQDSAAVTGSDTRTLTTESFRCGCLRPTLYRAASASFFIALHTRMTDEDVGFSASFESVRMPAERTKSLYAIRFVIHFLVVMCLHTILYSQLFLKR